MTTVYIVDIRRADVKAAEDLVRGTEFFSRLFTDGKMKYERRNIAYLLLSLFWKRHFGDVPFLVQFDEYGKPYTELGGSFAISYSDGVIAVAISPEKISLGIDIEHERQGFDYAGLRRRFLEGISGSEPRGCPDVEYLLYELDPDCNLIAIDEQEKVNNSLHFIDSSKRSFAAEWTLLEAVMKAEGRGFAAYPNAQELITDSLTDTRSIALCDELYAVTVAEYIKS